MEYERKKCEAGAGSLLAGMFCLTIRCILKHDCQGLCGAGEISQSVKYLTGKDEDLSVKPGSF